MRNIRMHSNSLKKRRYVSVWAALVTAMAAILIGAGVSGCGEETTGLVTVGDTGGRVQIRETYFDAGVVKVNEKVEHSYEIRNTGTGPLQLGQLAVKRLEGC